MDFFNLKCNNPTWNTHLMIKNLKQLWGSACVAGGLFGKRGKTRTKFFVISGADPGIFDGYGEGGGGGGPNFGSERTVELFCGK